MGLTDSLWSVYFRLQRRLAPGVRFAQSEFEDVLFESVTRGCRWLDFGCGHDLLPPWRATQEATLTQAPSLLVGLDPERNALRKHRSIALRICGDGASLPLPDDSFDLVTANMVVEHLASPESQFQEIARVLEPGGQFVFHTPNGTGYPTLLARAVPDTVRGLGARIVEGRGGADRFRTYYRANTPARIADLAQRSGMVMEQLYLVRSSATLPLVTPLAAVELLFIRCLGMRRLRWLRPNLIAVLRKPEQRVRE